MSTQPIDGLIDSRKVFDGKSSFSDLPIGSVVTYKESRVVKIARLYFNIRPYENGAQNRRVNAMIEKTGELIDVPGGLVFKIY